MRIDRPGGGSDRPRDGSDRPRETGGPPGRPLDYRPPPTLAEVERNRLIDRGELRWKHGRYEKSEPFDYVKFDDRLAKMKDVKLPDAVRDLPRARDAVPVDRWNWTKVDERKFSDYGMNPDHPKGAGKALGYEAIGYKVRDRAERLDAARDMADVSRALLPSSHVKGGLQETPWGTKFHTIAGIIGPNGRHATFESCWMIDQRGDGTRSARMITAWVRPHQERGDR